MKAKPKNRNEVKGETVATYKGRRYQLLVFIPRTTQGDCRALLMFFDRSRKFWVNGNELTEIEAKRKGNSSAKSK